MGSVVAVVAPVVVAVVLASVVVAVIPVVVALMSVVTPLVQIATVTVSVHPGLACRKDVLVQKIITKITLNALHVMVVVPVQLDQLMFLSANLLLVILAALTVSVYPGLACRKHVLVQKIITKMTLNALHVLLV
jgi:hypothetical protein